MHVQYIPKAWMISTQKSCQLDENFTLGQLFWFLSNNNNNNNNNNKFNVDLQMLFMSNKYMYNFAPVDDVPVVHHYTPVLDFPVQKKVFKKYVS